MLQQVREEGAQLQARNATLEADRLKVCALKLLAPSRPSSPRGAFRSTSPGGAIHVSGRGAASAERCGHICLGPLHTHHMPSSGRRTRSGSPQSLNPRPVPPQGTDALTERFVFR